MSDPSYAGASDGGEAVNESASPDRGLQAHTSSKEAKSSYTVRSGFPLLATSSNFVEEISRQVTALLENYVEAWKTAAGGLDASYSIEVLSPFTVFKSVYVQRGWHLFQVHWSEHQETRSSMYHSFVRVLTDSLHPLLSSLSINDTGTITLDTTLAANLPKEDSIKAMGVLFALRVIQSTTYLSLSKLSSRRCLIRIPIEADIYHILLALPLIIQLNDTFGDWSNRPELGPIDDVVYTLKVMTGDIALDLTSAEDNDDNSDPSPQGSDGPDDLEKENVFDVLIPTEYEARPASVNNSLSTKAHLDRKKGTWGRLRSNESEGDDMGMSRADLMRNLVRQRLQLPLRSDGKEEIASANERQDLVMDPIKVIKRGHSRDKILVTMPPSLHAEQELLKCREEVAQQLEEYETSKRQRIDGVDFTSLLPNMENSTSAAAPSANSAVLHDILTAARSDVVQKMRNSMKSSERES